MQAMTVSTGPMWNDVDNARDPDARTMDEQVEMRRKTKRLVDCELPEGFKLITSAPQQYWLDHQLRWGFKLVFGEHEHVARYLMQVSDEMQMQWAIQDFTAELLHKGVSLSQTRKRHQTTLQTPAPRTFIDAVATTGCRASVEVKR
jgi:hypothetical protein